MDLCRRILVLASLLVDFEAESVVEWKYVQSSCPSR